MSDDKNKLNKENLIEKLFATISLTDKKEAILVKNRLLNVKLAKPSNSNTLKLKTSDDLIKSCLSTFDINVIADILKENKLEIIDILSLTKEYKRFWGESSGNKGSITFEKLKTVIMCYYVDFIVNKYQKTKWVKLEGLDAINSLSQLNANNIALTLVKMANGLFTEHIKPSEKIQVMQFLFSIARWKDDKDFRDKQYNVENNEERIPNNNVLDISELRERILNSKKNLKDTI